MAKAFDATLKTELVGRYNQVSGHFYPPGPRWREEARHLGIARSREAAAACVDGGVEIGIPSS